MTCGGAAAAGRGRGWIGGGGGRGGAAGSSGNTGGVGAGGATGCGAGNTGSNVCRGGRGLTGMAGWATGCGVSPPIAYAESSMSSSSCDAERGGTFNEPAAGLAGGNWFKRCLSASASLCACGSILYLSYQNANGFRTGGCRKMGKRVYDNP
jgi:hypothetical protein